jgi:tetratricopeptide (TPR) repeat protein
MTLESAESRTSIRRFLPWIVAAAALALYLWTLNPWVSMTNLLQVSRTSGWTWQEELSGPLYWLVIYPLHWLPARSIPYALNLFSAVCAALSLALLARSVMLLPHDRTNEQRQREKSEFSLLTIRLAWMAPVVAALVCGLQISFWQNATVAVSDWPVAASNEMFDLLVFAYIVRCVLESRVDEDRPWLTKAAFVYGLAITNNWAMIAFLPLFLVALIWIRGLAFFNQRFLTRMFLWGCAGLLLYLLLPTVQSMANISKVPFWNGLATNLKFQQYALKGLPFNKALMLHGDAQFWVLGLSSLLPVLVMSVRWPAYFGDPSRIGVAITTFILQIAHAALFFLCLWVALGSQLSPKHRVGLPLLTLYYFGALSIGYFTGYFLLVFNPPAERSRRTPGYLSAINSVVQAAVWVIALVVPALLIQRNLPRIRELNGPAMEKFASTLAHGVPKGKTALFSDDPKRLFILQAYLTRSGDTRDYLFVDTSSLERKDYHRFLLKQYPGRWPVDPNTQDFHSPEMIEMLTRIANSNQVCYLHPSFGYFFEKYYPVPHGMSYYLTEFPTNTLLAPPLSENVLSENEKFWAKTREENIEPLLEMLAPPSPTNNPAIINAIVKRLHLVSESNGEAAILGTFYSQPLVYWGAELQKEAGRVTNAATCSELLSNAATCFDLAQQLNPDNVVATINLACNKALHKGEKVPETDPKTLEDQFGKYRKWTDVMNANGPFDDPSFCYGQGRVFVGGHLLRQAAHEFARAAQLAPDKLDARVWLAQIYVLANMAEPALKIIDDIHAHPEVVKLGRTNRAELLSVEISALLSHRDVEEADKAVQTALKEYPGAEDLYGTATRLFINNGRFTNALPVVEDQLRMDPNHPEALRAKGYICLQLGRFEEAIPPLTKAINSETNNFSKEYYTARLNRAIAYLKTDKLDESKEDAEAVEKVAPRMYQVQYILFDIASRQHDKKAALEHGQRYLQLGPESPDEIKKVSEQLKELKTGSP